MPSNLAPASNPPCTKYVVGCCAGGGAGPYMPPPGGIAPYWTLAGGM